jgi:hypothetical protein
MDGFDAAEKPKRLSSGPGFDSQHLHLTLPEGDNMAFHERPFSERFLVLGDVAESIYLNVAPLGKSERLGWRRPQVSMRKMGLELKHLPDFYADTGELVEVVGCGKDKVLKFKVSKKKALETWHAIQPVVVFAWNSHLEEWVVVEWDTFRSLCRTKDISSFNDGNRYYPIAWDDLKKVARQHGTWDETELAS